MGFLKINIRKHIHILESISYCIMLYFIFSKPEEFTHIGTTILLILISISLVYFTYEYFRYLKPKKILLLKLRVDFLNFNSIIALLGGLTLAIGLYINHDRIDSGFVQFTILSISFTIYGSVFNNQKNSPRLDSEKIYFKNIFSKDIFINQIQKASLDHENKNIYLYLNNYEKRTLKLNKEFCKEQETKLIKLIEYFNNVA